MLTAGGKVMVLMNNDDDDDDGDDGYNGDYVEDDSDGRTTWEHMPLPGDLWNKLHERPEGNLLVEYSYDWWWHR